MALSYVSLGMNDLWLSHWTKLVDSGEIEGGDWYVGHSPSPPRQPAMPPTNSPPHHPINPSTPPPHRPTAPPHRYYCITYVAFSSGFVVLNLVSLLSFVQLTSKASRNLHALCLR